MSTGTALTGAVHNGEPSMPLTREADAIAEQRRRAAATLPTMTFPELLAMGEHLVKTGFLPQHIRTGAQAAAIMLAGRELGLPPMRAFRSLVMVKGKVTEHADSQLSRFKLSGGRAVFRELTRDRAVLWLRHPNGDEHVEEYTRDDAIAAKLVQQNENYDKHGKAMMRSRVITAALKSLGWEGAVDIYDPDELEPETAAPLPDRPPLPTQFQHRADAAAREAETQADAVRDDVAGSSAQRTPPPTDKQRALMKRLMASHAFTDDERAAVEQITSADIMSRAIDRAQKLIVERKAAEKAEAEASAQRVADGVAAAVADADAPPDEPAPMSSLLGHEEDPDAAMRNALREGR